MTKLIFPALLLALSLFSFGTLAQSSSSANLEAAQKAITTANERFFTDVLKNDGSIANHYTDDAWIMAPNGPATKGHDAIVQFFQAAVKAGVGSGQFTTLAVYGDGQEYVTEVGMAKVYLTSGQLLTEDKYLVLWKKTTDGWRMYRDMFNSAQPKN